jgi:hypothetical protein
MKLKKRSNKPESGERTVLDDVDDFMEKNELQQFTSDNIDKSYIQLPSDLEEVESKELGRYLNHLTQQRIWVRTLATRAEIVLYDMEEKLAREKSRVFSPLPVKMSVTEKELKLYEDEAAARIIEEIKPLRARSRMLADYSKSLEDAIFLTSREIARRENDFTGERRVDNIDRKKRR